MDTLNMRVTKRNGELEDIYFDKILKRIKIQIILINMNMIVFVRL